MLVVLVLEPQRQEDPRNSQSASLGKSVSSGPSKDPFPNKQNEKMGTENSSWD